MNVHYIVEGNVQRNEESIRVNVQLINAITGTTLWAISYENEMKETDDLSDIQSKIIQDISAKIEEFKNPY